MTSLRSGNHSDLSALGGVQLPDVANLCIPFSLFIFLNSVLYLGLFNMLV